MSVGANGIPKFKSQVIRDKTKQYCLVIPVLNEGERLVSLLRKIRNLDVVEFDVLIADAGSTDGSTDPSLLTDLGVSFLLTNQDKKGLGSQLRGAYGFALKQGYSGVITIDGNDKDDPQDIPEFIKALKGGFDVVQASRFIPGGQEVNTPISRSLAIRLIHAPLLSLVSGFRWTDTTQGFRAYSRKLLLSDDMQIFRHVFVRYELLAYVNYMAPKCGLNCVEIPTSRKYPEGEIPTKISGLKGNLEILKTLFAVCLGKFNPPN